MPKDWWLTKEFLIMCLVGIGCMVFLAVSCTVYMVTVWRMRTKSEKPPATPPVSPKPNHKQEGLP
ncbi:MAG: hypothetical protein K1Y36_26740 [Blastocatellia bacterium]|nr:hypothetical protein [Blastocatellia bacterium]